MVSYADGQMGHVGYIYQATNFLYCGAKKSHDVEYLIDGKWTHAKVLTNRGIKNLSLWAKENNLEIKKPANKHRYVYIFDKKHIGALKYKTEPYPKGRTMRYESDDIHLKEK